MQEHARIVHDIKLVDSLDIVAIAMKLEDSLGIKISDEAWCKVQTLGQMHDLVCHEAKQIQVKGLKCASAMSFYRLKTAINHTTTPRRLSPSTSLKSLSDINYIAVSRLFKNWEMPKRTISAFGLLLSLAITLATNIPLSHIIGDWSIVTGIVSFFAYLTLMAYLIPSRLPAEKTIGELATAITARNLRRLSEQGAALTPNTLWKALVWIVANEMEIAPEHLSRESRFI